MTPDAKIVEAVADAIQNAETFDSDCYIKEAQAAILAARPMIEAQMRERLPSVIEINNALHRLNLDRPDIAKLPDGNSISRNVADDRQMAAILKKVRTALSPANTEEK